MAFIPLILIAILYARMGTQLGKNPIIWLFMGMGIVTALEFTGSLFTTHFKNPDVYLTAWSLTNIISWILAAIIAYVIYYKNKHRQSV
jgi:hypothetical protein